MFSSSASSAAAPRRAIELDFLRGVALLLVLTAHYTPLLYFYIGLDDIGWAGVDLFFILSGFLVGGLLLKEWKKTGHVDGFRFLRRRAFKIWPAYYFYLFIVWISNEHPWKTYLVGNLFNIQNYTGTSLHQTWTLAVEEHFYLLLTLLLTFASLRKIRSSRLLAFVLVTGAVVLVVRTISCAYQLGPYPLAYTHTRIDALLDGFALALVFNFFPALFQSIQKQRLALWLGFLACLGCVAFRHRIGIPYNLEILFADLASGAILLLVFRPVTNLNRRWPYRLVALVGIYSYGIYLWHLAAYTGTKIVASHLHILTPLVVSTVPFAAACVLGAIMTHLIEFPFLKLREIMVPSIHGSHLTPDPRPAESAAPAS